METETRPQEPHRRRKVEDVLVRQNKEAVRALLERALGGGDLGVIDRFVAPDVVAYDVARPGPIEGIEEYRANIETYRQAVPDLSVDVKQVVAEGDYVLARWVSQGTHRGHLLGIPPTGKFADDISGQSLYRMENGRVVETWTNWDAFGLLQKLGIGAPARGAPGEAVDEIRSQLEAVMKDLGEAFSHGDATTAARLFTPDATLIDPTGVLATGRDEIEKTIAGNLSDLLGGSTSRFTVERLRPLDGGVVFADLVHHISGLTAPNGPSRMELNVVMLAKDVGGRWMLLDARPHTYHRR